MSDRMVNSQTVVLRLPCCRLLANLMSPFFVREGVLNIMSFMVLCYSYLRLSQEFSDIQSRKFLQIPCSLPGPSRRTWSKYVLSIELFVIARILII